MPYVVVGESVAVGDEFARDALARIKSALDANVAVLKAGDRVVTTDTITLGAHHAVGQFPAIQIEATGSEETATTLQGSRLNTLRMTFRLFGYELALGQPATLAQNLLQFSDRIQTVLRHNRTLDGFCRDLRIERAIFGRMRGGPRSSNPVFAPHPILATQIEAAVVKDIERP